MWVFIDGSSKISQKPLSSLLMKGVPFEFNDSCTKTFELLKKKLILAPIVVAPDWDLPFQLMCDARDFTVGAVLGQIK